MELMSPAQRRIIIGAPRWLRYYVGPSKHGLIPDTVKARKWAIETRNATHFDSFTFHRLNIDGTIGDYVVGDFYGTVSEVPIKRRSETDPSIRDVVSGMLRVLGLMDESVCQILELESGAVDLLIPSAVFGMADGSSFLPYFYEEFGLGLQRIAKRSGVHSIHNKAISSEIWLRYAADRTELSWSSSFTSAQMLKWDILEPCKTSAISRRAPIRSSSSPEWTQPVQSLGPHNPEISGNLECSDFNSARPCAQDIIEWIRTESITEFRRQNALEAFDGKWPLNGKSRQGGGIADALSLLVNRGYLKSCPRFPKGYAGYVSTGFLLSVRPLVLGDYPCRPPSPWYLVNPAVHGDKSLRSLRRGSIYINTPSESGPVMELKPVWKRMLPK